MLRIVGITVQKVTVAAVSRARLTPFPYLSNPTLLNAEAVSNRLDPAKSLQENISLAEKNGSDGITGLCLRQIMLHTATDALTYLGTFFSQGCFLRPAPVKVRASYRARRYE